jgi:hypothetical protein
MPGFPAAGIAALYAERFPSYWRGGPRKWLQRWLAGTGRSGAATASKPAGPAAYILSQ